MKMPFMGGIERPTEDTDAYAPPVAMDRDAAQINNPLTGV